MLTVSKTYDYSLLKHSIFSTYYANSNIICYSLIQKVCRAEIIKRPKQVGHAKHWAVLKECLSRGEKLWVHQ